MLSLFITSRLDTTLDCGKGPVRKVYPGRFAASNFQGRFNSIRSAGVSIIAGNGCQGAFFYLDGDKSKIGDGVVVGLFDVTDLQPAVRLSEI